MLGSLRDICPNFSDMRMLYSSCAFAMYKCTRGDSLALHFNMYAVKTALHSTRPIHFYIHMPDYRSHMTTVHGEMVLVPCMKATCIVSL